GRAARLHSCSMPEFDLRRRRRRADASQFAEPRPRGCLRFPSRAFLFLLTREAIESRAAVARLPVRAREACLQPKAQARLSCLRLLYCCLVIVAALSPLRCQNKI